MPCWALRCAARTSQACPCTVARCLLHTGHAFPCSTYHRAHAIAILCRIRNSTQQPLVHAIHEIHTQHPNMPLASQRKPTHKQNSIPLYNYTQNVPIDVHERHAYPRDSKIRRTSPIVLLAHRVSITTTEPPSADLTRNVTAPPAAAAVIVASLALSACAAVRSDVASGSRSTETRATDTGGPFRRSLTCMAERCAGCCAVRSTLSGGAWQCAVCFGPIRIVGKAAGCLLSVAASAHMRMLCARRRPHAEMRSPAVTVQRRRTHARTRTRTYTCDHFAG